MWINLSAYNNERKYIIMNKRTLTLIVAMVAALLIATTGTLAYLTDTDGAVNVMTVGNVDIEQIEEQRPKIGSTELEEFEQFKPFLPAVHDTNDDNKIAWADVNEWPVPKGFEGDPNAYKVFNNNISNVQDKFVSVENTGKNDAYVRTIIAIEDPVGNQASIHIGDNVDVEGLTCEKVGYVELDGVQYYVISYLYPEKLAPGERTIPSLKQVFLDKAATSEDVALFGENFEILTLSQAVQADGFDNADEALSEGFYNVGKDATPEEKAQLKEDLETLLSEGYPSLWDGTSDTSWYNDTDTEFVLTTAEQLAGLSELVNGGNDFAGKTIKLGANMDLADQPWTPIGNWDHTFSGDFDGQGHTISNLFINDTDETTGDGIGLIGVATSSDIKGITINNVDITGYSEVAAIVGAPYTGCTITDCHVTGDISLTAEWAYVGGIAAYGYVDIKDCSVIADGTGTITSETRNAVGGIVAWVLENGNEVRNCQAANLELTGWTNVGGIAGFLHYNNVMDGCSAENIVLTKTREDGIPAIGLACGGWCYGSGKTTTITNNSFSNITLNGQAVPYAAANILYGGEYYGKTDTSGFVLSNNSQSDITNNLTVVTP